MVAFVVESKTRVQEILGWPTDTFSIDVKPVPVRSGADDGAEDLHKFRVHTIIIFTPGNPGLIEWYISFFEQIVRELGPGFASRGVANACHSLDHEMADARKWQSSHERNIAVPWTVDGQSLHKCAFMDLVMNEFNNEETNAPNFIFASHSIGCHFAQRMCVMRSDILQRTKLFLHMTPYIRMNAPMDKQLFLDFCSARQGLSIPTVQRLVQSINMLPQSIRDAMVAQTMTTREAGQITLKLLQVPEFIRNFGTLGLEEIRDVPEVFDVYALRLMGKQCPVEILFASNDHWCPIGNLRDLEELKASGAIPSTISTTHIPQLKHDFVTAHDQVPLVIQYCLSRIRSVTGLVPKHRQSRL